MCYETSKNQQKIKLNGNREKLTLEYFMERKKIFWKKRNRIRTSKRQLAEYKNWKLLDGKEMRGRGGGEGTILIVLEMLGKLG